MRPEDEFTEATGPGPAEAVAGTVGAALMGATMERALLGLSIGLVVAWILRAAVRGWRRGLPEQPAPRPHPA
jgi:hypothetical protein